jgi:hypothetical protein
MSDLKKAAQQALEALETVFMPHHPAVISLRAALEQPEQEPVAWMVYTQDGKSVCVTDNPADFIEWRSFPLYTHPPRREWRGLTNLEFVQIELKLRKYHDYDRYDLSLNEFGRAIEAALKERNV